MEENLFSCNKRNNYKLKKNSHLLLLIDMVENQFNNNNKRNNHRKKIRISKLLKVQLIGSNLLNNNLRNQNKKLLQINKNNYKYKKSHLDLMH